MSELWGLTRDFTMKPTLLSLALLILATACDAPQQRRLSGTFDNSSTSTGAVEGTNGFTTNPTTTGGATAGTTTGSTTGSTTGQTIKCIKNVVAFHAGLGNVDVCEDSANEVSFKLGFSTTDQSDGTCIVPMYKDTAGNSTYLGTAQCTKHNQGQIVYGNVSKNRSGYAGYQINSVMVLKYSGTSAFYQCMNAYGVSFQSCMGAYGNNSFYQSYCDTQAKNYMTGLCNTFKSNYPYSQVSTR
jgi:hypothetical protein